MRTLVAGATGFLGTEVVPRLIAAGHQVRCLVRGTSHSGLLPATCERAVGDLGDVDSLRAAAAGMEAVVHTTNMLFADMEAVTRAYFEAGITRGVFIGTAAIYTSIHPENKQRRLAAEAAIARSGLAYTILRPTMIYGNQRDRNVCRLIRFLQRWPVLPIVGDGRAQQQPVHVSDVAGAIVSSLESPTAVNRCYDIGGASAVTLELMADTICARIGRRVWKLRLPARPAIALTRLAERVGVSLPVRSAQFLRLAEDKRVDNSPACRDLGYAPLSFEEGVRRQLQGQR